MAGFYTKGLNLCTARWLPSLRPVPVPVPAPKPGLLQWVTSSETTVVICPARTRLEHDSLSGLARLGVEILRYGYGMNGR